MAWKGWKGRSQEGEEGVRIEDVWCARETEKAILVELDGYEKWIPKSCIHDDSEVYDSKDHCEGVLVVKRWFAEKEGLA